MPQLSLIEEENVIYKHDRTSFIDLEIVKQIGGFFRPMYSKCSVCVTCAR
jgi:hypothetical protein